MHMERNANIVRWNDMARFIALWGIGTWFEALKMFGNNLLILLKRRSILYEDIVRRQPTNLFAILLS